MTDKNPFDKLVAIMAKLRAPDGCPWDRKQSYRDIAAHTLEETYEVLEAIDADDLAALREELGDLLLQVVFYAQIAKEDGLFDIGDVLDGINEKLIRRHPHVFGEKTVSGEKEVLERWEEIKKDEGKKSVLGGVPKSLPSLLKAFRIGEKTSRVGFDWSDIDGVLEKISEEVQELAEAREKNNVEAINEEYGDLLFTIANLGRFLKTDPESALRQTCKKFIDRFSLVERMAEQNDLVLKKIPPKKWDELWENAKKQLAK